jgi:UDP-glucose 4-epimerase
MERPILVTGGAGYIGSHAVLALTERAEKVIVLDDLSTGARERVPAGVTLIDGSIGDRELIRSVLKEHAIESILHFAGVVKVEESVRDPQKYHMINVDYTRILAEEARAAGVSHFIFSSSASVYGNAEQVPVDEDAPLMPVSPYAETKRDAEVMLGEVLGAAVPHVFLRYFNVAGTDPSGRAGYPTKEKPTHLIRSAVRAALLHEPFTINGSDYPTPDGTCVRDYIHVSDLADAHVSALEYLRTGGASRVFNCGSGHGYSNAEVVKSVQRIAQTPLDITMGPRRAGDPAALVADISRINRELGWKPHFGLDAMIEHEVSWTRKHL